MGKGPRPGAEKAVKAFEKPIWDANTLLARKAGNIMYGGDTSSPENYQRSMGGPSPGVVGPSRRAQPRGGQSPTGSRRQYTGGVTGGRNPTGILQGGQTGDGQRVNYDRVYEVYRAWQKAGSDPNRAREHPWRMGPAEWELFDKIREQGGTFQAAHDYREAQKRGASAEELAQFAPGNVGFEGYSGDPRTHQDMVDDDTSRGVGPGSDGGGGQGPGMGGPGGVVGGTLGDYGEILNRYRQFADTGGYSPQDTAAIRSRALSPVRAAYSDVNRDVDRSRSLTGDYAPGYAATRAKTGREQAYATADASTNVEAALAQMVQQGKLAGMGGMAGMYGTTPGLASMFGQQALQGQQLQNQAAQQLTSARMGVQQMPGPVETTIGRAGQIGGALYPFMSTREAKENIEPVKKSILTRLKKLPISTWNYKGEPGRVHVGPMAEDFFEQFGGSEKTISPVDVAGVLLGAAKELAENASA